MFGKPPSHQAHDVVSTYVNNVVLTSKQRCYNVETTLFTTLKQRRVLDGKEAVGGFPVNVFDVFDAFLRRCFNVVNNGFDVQTTLYQRVKTTLRA